MKITEIVSINFKKLKEQRSKAMFLIAPVFILMALTVVFASQIKNIQENIDISIFQTLKDQATLIQINKMSQNSQQDLKGRFGGGANGGSFSTNIQDTEFTQTDIAAVSKIAGVTSTSLNSNVPILNIFSNDLFSNTKYTISALSELDSTSAGLFTTENFDYKEGEPIPVILNSNTFTQRYEDWGGKNEVDIKIEDFRGSRTGTKKTVITPETNPSPIKTKAIEYNKDSLIGKTFTLNFGGLDEIQDYTISFDNGTQKFVKLSKSDMSTKVSNRKTSISKYWNYAKIAKPITYTFKVVCIVSDSSNNSSYIPAAFANKVMHDYLSNEIKARVSTIPTTVLNSTYTGLTYDGTQFQNNNNFRGTKAFFGGFARVMQGDSASNNVTYNIPGLVITTSTDGSGTVNGVNNSYNIYENSLKSAQYLTIKIDSVFNRTAIVKALNTAGYAYQDGNNFDVFNKIQSTVQSVSLGFSVAFIVISSLIVLFAMAKFVSDSRKEIGIFRAIGMKKMEVVTMFTSQSILYVLFAYILGIGIGVASNYLLSPLIYTWFNNFISTTIKQSFNVVPVLNNASFNGFDWKSIGIYSGVLIFIAIIVSLVPAFRASQVSPIEAIKGEN